MTTTRLGLIGDNIARSQSPRLHELAGQMCGLDISYERLIPRDLGLDIATVFDRCAVEGYRGINVTYPYKEDIVSRVSMPDPRTARINACNTVLFGDGKPQGHNTDYTGFIAAFRSAFGNISPGTVAMAGAGGVGKAVAFALDSLGAGELRIFDTDARKAADLALALRSADTSMIVGTSPTLAAATQGADGLVNCTPVGMSGHAGSAFQPAHMHVAAWAFDAVYTPVDTLFLRFARQAGLQTMTGYELFFHQGLDAFRHFTGQDVDPGALRRALANRQKLGA